MSKKANKTVIGGFVLGAVILLISGLLVFGSGGFFEEKRTVVLFFPGSIKGLDIGAPVLFKGVKIGSVSDIRLNFRSKDLKVWIPVYAEFESDLITVTDDPEFIRKTNDTDGKAPVLEQMITLGLRAKLSLQSVVTGKQYIALEFSPEEPIVLQGLDPELTEIPTVPTSFQQAADTAKEILEEIRDLPLNDLLVSATSLFERLEEVASSLTTEETVKT